MIETSSVHSVLSLMDLSLHRGELLYYIILYCNCCGQELYFVAFPVTTELKESPTENIVLSVHLVMQRMYRGFPLFGSVYTSKGRREPNMLLHSNTPQKQKVDQNLNISTNDDTKLV